MTTNTTTTTDAEGKVTTVVHNFEDEVRTGWAKVDTFLHVALGHAETFGSAAWKIALGYAIAHSTGLAALLHSL